MTTEVDMSLSREALSELLEQHAQIRHLMARCEEIADTLEDDAATTNELVRAVAKLRIAFDAHNRCEEAVLRSVFRSSDPPVAARLDGMVDSHIREHRTVRDYLIDPSLHSLRQAIATLRHHLEEEERGFFASLRPEARGPSPEAQ